MKKLVLNGIAKCAKGAVKEACGSKSTFIFFEADMPKSLKDKKMNKK